ncbi:MAG: helix-turn-helix transcriptional regulator [Pleurocapsa sp. SU_196_0]|nr:helix-turn-helix transcriptional regulator [Pleurocapsa sp. SU_196_0]
MASTLRRLARRSGLSHNYISEILNAKRGKRPSFDTIQAFEERIACQEGLFLSN